MKKQIFFCCMFFFLAAPAFSEPNVFLMHGDDYFETQAFQNLSTLKKIEEIDYGLASIYEDYTGESFINVEDIALQYRMRSFTLSNDFSKNAELLALMEQAKINAPEFLSAFRAAIERSKAEKQKTADELYALSCDIGESYPLEIAYLVEGLKREYLKLAADKGHKKAQTEYEAHEKKLRAFIERKEKEFAKERALNK